MTFKHNIMIEMIIIKINIPPTILITIYKASNYNIASRGKCRLATLTSKTVAIHLLPLYCRLSIAIKLLKKKYNINDGSFST